MTTKEIGSLSNQIPYCYSANKKSSHPSLHLSVSSSAGQTYENLSRVEGLVLLCYMFTLQQIKSIETSPNAIVRNQLFCDHFPV